MRVLIAFFLVVGVSAVPPHKDWWWDQTSPSTRWATESTTEPGEDATISSEMQHQERQCSKNVQNLWLDIVVLIDSTKSAGSDGFTNQRAALLYIFGYDIPLGLGTRSTRLGIVNVGDDATVVANLTAITSASRLQPVLLGASYKNADNYNLFDGLSKAKDLLEGSGSRANARKAIIVFSTKSFVCTLSSSEITRDDDPCKVASVFKQNDWSIIAVASKFTSTVHYPNVSLGFPCYETSDPNPNDIIKSFLTDINCFCQSGYQQFVDGQCGKTAACVRLSGDLHVGYDAASFACLASSEYLPTVFSNNKEIFLKNIALYASTSTNQFTPFWLGLRRYGGAGAQWYWNSGEDLNDLDYRNWAAGQPVTVTNGDCGVIATSGFASNWQSKSCRDGYAYFCQSYACDADVYCS